MVTDWLRVFCAGMCVAGFSGVRLQLASPAHHPTFGENSPTEALPQARGAAGDIGHCWFRSRVPPATSLTWFSHVICPREPGVSRSVQAQCCFSFTGSRQPGSSLLGCIGLWGPQMGVQTHHAPVPRVETRTGCLLLSSQVAQYRV